ncbi:hypothetical protein OEZ85_014157 [Tetradesmus obliquus]|uniref:Uncharacterized protein n=1 Tax=Tetradesmus obliquus TaxID=3088 RepID=A0ABY8U751_TETOB|nr:hypothetical protein OEZ85_014157 [Tetradesmus obliquus]
MDELTEPLQRSTSLSKDKALQWETGAIPAYLQPRMLFLYVASAMLLVEHAQALAADAAKYKFLAKKAYARLKVTRSAYKSVRAAADKAVKELQALQKDHAQTKAQLQELQERNAALQALVEHDSDARSVPGNAEVAHGQAGSNTTEQDRELTVLAGQVALAVPGASSTGGTTTSREVVLVVCDAARSQGIDIFRSWCQSTALAELDNTIVLAAHDDCSHVARKAGLHSILYSSPEAKPDMLLVDSPYQYLLPSPLVDLHVMSGALNGDGLGNRHAELQGDTAQHMHSVHMAGLSPALMHLKPNKACLQFVDAMLQRTAPAAIRVVHSADQAQRMAAIVNSYRGLPGPLDALPAAAEAAHTTLLPAQRTESSNAASGSDAGHCLHAQGVAHLMHVLHPVEQLLEKLGLDQ